MKLPLVVANYGKTSIITILPSAVAASYVTRILHTAKLSSLF